MKKNILIILITLCSISLKGQFGITDGNSSVCLYINANTAISGNFLTRNIPKRATFKVNFKLAGAGIDNCTGTLINRKTTQNELGFFFITAGHCFSDTDLSDPNKEFDLIFNYESPTSVSTSTPTSNRGAKTNTQPPTNIQSVNTQMTGFQYIHRSKLRLVVKNSFRDFALFEILKPIPPHFNVAYAGWHPGFIFNLSPINGSFNYTVFHHPANDIKKISTTSTVLSIRPLEHGCRSITKIIDAVFGWIWGRNKSTQVICSIPPLDIGRAWVPFWTAGTITSGSSGASLINNRDKIVGVLWSTAADLSCQFQNVVFNKLRSNYYDESVRSVLNPSKGFWTDELGIDGDIITCYQSLNGLNGEYFAGKDYNSNSGIVNDNKTTLQSATTITTNGALRIHPGADYVFISPNGTTLNSGFEIVAPTQGETKGIFEIKTGSCIIPRSDKNADNIPYSILEKAKKLQLPEYMPFNLTLDKNSVTDLNGVQAYPNPSSDGNFTIRFVVDAKKEVNLSVIDILGKTVYSTPYNCIQGENYFPLDMSRNGLSAGIYFITLQDGAIKKVKKVIVE